MYQYFLTQITNNEIQKYVQSFYLPKNYLIYAEPALGVRGA